MTLEATHPEDNCNFGRQVQKHQLKGQGLFKAALEILDNRQVMNGPRVEKERGLLSGGNDTHSSSFLDLVMLALGLVNLAFANWFCPPMLVNVCNPHTNNHQTCQQFLHLCSDGSWHDTENTSEPCFYLRHGLTQPSTVHIGNMFIGYMVKLVIWATLTDMRGSLS